MICVNSLGDDFPTFQEFQRMLRDYEREMATPSPTQHVVRGVVSASTPFDYSGYCEGIRKAIDSQTPQYTPPPQAQFFPPERYEQAFAAHRAAYNEQQAAQEYALQQATENYYAGLVNQQHQETEQ